MKGDAAEADAEAAATDREIHVIIRGNYHDAPSMHLWGEQRTGEDFGFNLGRVTSLDFQATMA